jgi:hypothetical protein
MLVNDERTRQTGTKQTENTGIDMQAIIGRKGNTWKGVETSTRTDETDQGVTPGPPCLLTHPALMHIIHWLVCEAVIVSKHFLPCH